MAEYIDREALIEQVKAIHKAVDTSGINISYDSGFHSATSQIQGLIAWMPATDVAEVKHGEWVEKWDSQHFVSSCICSVCGKGTHRNSLMEWAKGAYCQNCGAKMDGKEGAVD